MGQLPTDFYYRITTDGRVRIAWQGRHVVTLSGQKAGKFIQDSTDLDPMELQLLLARVTGNFKRGNERSPRKK